MKEPCRDNPAVNGRSGERSANRPAGGNTFDLLIFLPVADRSALRPPGLPFTAGNNAPVRISLLP